MNKENLKIEFLKSKKNVVFKYISEEEALDFLNKYGLENVVDPYINYFNGPTCFSKYIEKYEMDKTISSNILKACLDLERIIGAAIACEIRDCVEKKEDYFNRRGDALENAVLIELSTHDDRLLKLIRDKNFLEIYAFFKKNKKIKNIINFRFFKEKCLEYADFLLLNSIYDFSNMRIDHSLKVINYSFGIKIKFLNIMDKNSKMKVFENIKLKNIEKFKDFIYETKNLRNHLSHLNSIFLKTQDSKIFKRKRRQENQNIVFKVVQEYIHFNNFNDLNHCDILNNDVEYLLKM